MPKMSSFGTITGREDVFAPIVNNWRRCHLRHDSDDASVRPRHAPDLPHTRCWSRLFRECCVGIGTTVLPR